MVKYRLLQNKDEITQNLFYKKLFFIIIFILLFIILFYVYSQQYYNRNNRKIYKLILPYNMPRINNNFTTSKVFEDF